MKTIEQILEENKSDMIHTYTGAYWGTYTVMEMMREYAREVIDDILTRPDMIYIEGMEDENYPETALYNYEKFDEYKENLP